MLYLSGAIRGVRSCSPAAQRTLMIFDIKVDLDIAGGVRPGTTGYAEG